MPPVCPSLSPGALRRQTLYLPLAACRGLYSPGSFPSLSGPAVSGLRAQAGTHVIHLSANTNGWSSFAGSRQG